MPPTAAEIKARLEKAVDKEGNVKIHFYLHYFGNLFVAYKIADNRSDFVTRYS